MEETDLLDVMLNGNISREEFFRDIYQRRHFVSQVDSSLKPYLPTWDQFNQYLNDHSHSSPRMLVVNDMVQYQDSVFYSEQHALGYAHTRLRTAELYKQLRSGSTIALDSIHEVIPPLKELQRRMAAIFSCNVNMKGFITCRRQEEAFGMHWDNWDAFIVQLHGRKHWKIYGFTRKAPIRATDIVACEKPRDPIWEGVIEEGQIVYLPRGYWHRVEGVDVTSLHIAICLHCTTGIDFLHWIASQLQSHEFLRENLPRPGEDLRSYAAQVKAAFAAFDFEAAVPQFMTSQEDKLRSDPTLTLPIGLPDPEMRASTSIRFAPFKVSVTESDSATLQLRGGGRNWSVARDLAPLIERLRSGDWVRLDEAFRLIRLGRPDSNRAHCVAEIDDMVTTSLLEAREFD
jgi:ribosomal protein L16 Arg81 hydroxylase